MALCVIIGISAYLLLLRPKRTFSQLRPNGFMPDAALVRPGTGVLAEWLDEDSAHERELASGCADHRAAGSASAHPE